jgi:hypothetical protein
MANRLSAMNKKRAHKKRKKLFPKAAVIIHQVWKKYFPLVAKIIKKKILREHEKVKLLKKQQHMHHIILSMNEKKIPKRIFAAKLFWFLFSSFSFSWNLYSHMMPFMWPIVCIFFFLFFAVKREHYVHQTFVFNFPIHLKKLFTRA